MGTRNIGERRKPNCEPRPRSPAGAGGGIGLRGVVHMVQPGRRVVGHPVLLYVLLLLLESQPNVWQAKSEFRPIAERIFVCIELAREMALNGHL